MTTEAQGLFPPPASCKLREGLAFKLGQILKSGFKILDIRELAEYEALGIWAKHQKNGVEVYHIYNDDKENLFSFVFATPPKDSTGVAHILEHSVLCGSESYPLKDTFLVLDRGSLQTLLNALTCPDKTIYLASSVNEQDYFNIMAVYGDAIFRPLLSEWTFMQEGHHLFFTPAASGGNSGKNPKRPSGLQISGVVYNEMKGAYSSPDNYAGIWSIKSVMPGTPYEFDYGGDPDCIPGLNLEGLREFHRTWYTPANCRIFLAGNIPTEKQLDFLERKFFSSLPPGNRNKPIPKVKRWDSPRSFVVPCPYGAERKPTVLLSWLFGEITDAVERLSLAVLNGILLGHDGSPLTRALIDSNLGEDLSPASGFEGDLGEVSFCVGLKGVGASEKVEGLILDELKRLEREGIPKEEIEAALFDIEFSNREINRSGGPLSVVLMRRTLRSWFYEGKPWDSLLLVPPLLELKRLIKKDGRYFEKMIRHYLLDNPHRAKITMEPEKGFLEKKEVALKRCLEEKLASLSGEEREFLRKKSAELALFQEKEDDPAALAAIPHLSRKDLSPEIDTIKREYVNASGVPALVHPVFTNGISYFNFAFPLDVFPPEDYPWFPFFTMAVLSMGLPGLDYGEVSTIMARTVGGFSGIRYNAPLLGGVGKEVELPTGVHDIRNRDWIIFSLKSLDGEIGPSLDLAYRLLTEADFSDLKRLGSLVLEMRGAIDSSLAHHGHHYASNFSCRFFSRACAIDELWNGLDQVFFAHKLQKLNLQEISNKLKVIQANVVKAGLLLNYTGAVPLEAEREMGRRFGAFGPPQPRNPASQDIENIFALLDKTPATGKPWIFASPSLQVGFTSITLKAEPFASPLAVADTVLAHLLNTGTLWEEIRMKGGAYGAYAAAFNLESLFTFSTYRDPNPLASLKALPPIIAGLCDKPASRKVKGDLPDKTVPLQNETTENEALEKAIIGVYAKETHPSTPAEKGSSDFFRFLTGIEESYRSQRLKGIIGITEGQIDSVKKRLGDEINAALKTNLHCPVIIAGKTEAGKAATHFGVEVRKLPV